jgi:adenylate kinase
MNVIILLGAPGSGKGTAAERIRQNGYVHVSTGDMLREAVKQGTAVGREAEGYMKRGELVPDAVMIRVIEDRFDREGSGVSFLLDGFPRTIPQADLLDQSLARRGIRIEHVFFLETPRDILITRLAGRRICRQCGTNYHVVNVPPKTEGICDACGGELYQRPDDQPATVENRLTVYERQTAGLIARYEKQGCLVRVNSNQGPDRLATDMLRVLKGRPRKESGRRK